MTVARAFPWLVAAAIVAWPVALGAALADRVRPPTTIGGDLVYRTASRVCHQRADRSFVTAGEPWPVCARCTGLYLAAPLGAALALAAGRRRALSRHVLVSSVVTSGSLMAVTWGAEALGGLPVADWVRMSTSLPAGLAIAAAVVTVVAPVHAGNRVD